MLSVGNLGAGDRDPRIGDRVVGVGGSQCRHVPEQPLSALLSRWVVDEPRDMCHEWMGARGVVAPRLSGVLSDRLHEAGAVLGAQVRTG